MNDFTKMTKEERKKFWKEMENLAAAIIEDDKEFLDKLAKY